MSFPRNVGQCPIYYNHMKTGRPTPSGNVFWSHYTDAPNTPLFPFGYGLSYTNFTYSQVKTDKESYQLNESIKLSLLLSNTGEFEGEEVVQVYIQAPSASFARPVKELKAFKKIKLAVNEERKIIFELNQKDLGYYSPEGEFLFESGDYNIYVGTNSQEVQKIVVSFIE